MTVLMPRMLSRLEDLLEWAGPGTHLIRVEEHQDDGAYRIRAELPGMEAKDIKVSVDHGMLRIEAERSEEKKDKYGKGILEVTVPVGKQKPAGRAIPIEQSK